MLVAAGIAYPYSVDVNGDGRQDIVAAGLRSRSGGATPVGLLAWRLGDGTGAFAGGTSTSSGEVNRSLAIGDLNGDGKLDLVAAKSGREDFTGYATAFLGDGGTAFTPASSPDTGTGSTAVALGDFNGDGKADAAVANYGSGDVSILLGDGSGTLNPAGAFPAHDGPRSLTVADVDGDGKVDLVVANAVSRDVSVLRGTGTGAFENPVNFETGEMTTLAASREFDCNGTQDLAVANNVSGTVSILMNTAPGSGPSGCLADRTGPAVRVTSASLRLRRTEIVALKLKCPAGERAGCASTVRIRTASRVRVKVSVQARDQAGNSRTTTRTLKLRRA